MSAKTEAERPKCKDKVWVAYGAGHRAPCPRYAVRDGYCARHDPDTKAAKKATSEARRRAGWRVNEALCDVGKAERALLVLARGGALDDVPSRDIEAALVGIRAADAELTKAREAREKLYARSPARRRRRRYLIPHS